MADLNFDWASVEMMGDNLMGQVGSAYAALKHRFTWPFFLWTAAVVIPTWLTYKLLIKPFLSPLRAIPGLPYIPIMGNMREIFSGEAMVATINAMKKHGLITRYYFFGGSERVIVGDPAAMKHILVTNSRNYIKPPDRIKLMRIVLGDGLVTSEGAKHARHKKLMSPAFNQSSILKMVPIFNTYSRQLIKMYKEKITTARGDCDDKNFWLQFPFLEDMSRLTLDIIGKAAFGYDFNSIYDQGNIISQSFARMVGGTGLTWKMLLPFYTQLPFERMRQLNSDVKLVHQKIQEMIEHKNKIRIEKGSEFVLQDLLDMMMSAQDEVSGLGLTNSELIDEVITIMGAGHETTAVALSWCLFALSNDLTIQECAREEVLSVLSSLRDGEDITLEDVDRMEYITAVCKETLRFYPSVPVTIRQALSDDVLCDYKIPKGTILLLAQGSMMRMPSVVENGEVFNPHRWMDGKSLDLYAFLPFLLGPRMCLGYKFAMIEMKIILIYLLKNFKFKPVPGLKIKRKSGGITMRPLPSLELRVSLVE